MKEIAIYGGSFNPPTIAHAEVIAALARQEWLDEIVILPSGNRKDKTYDTTEQQRYEMIASTLADQRMQTPRVQISELEFVIPKPTQTWKTYQALKQQYPNDRLWMVYGMDAYNDMPKWHHGDQLKGILNLLLIPRDHVAVPRAENIRQLDVGAMHEVSSTEVRRRCALNLPIDHLVTPSVERFIHENNLYMR